MTTQAAIGNPACQISIQEVLALMSDTDEGDTTFSLGFVRAASTAGGRRGSIRIIAHARRGTPSGRELHIKSPGAQKTRPLHKERDTIPIVDSDTGKYKSPKVSHIIMYNGMRVMH